VKAFNLEYTQPFINIELIQQCHQFAETKTSSANPNYFRGGQKRSTQQIYQDEYWGKIGECVFQQLMKKRGITTDIDFNIYRANQDHGDLIDTHNKKQYEIKTSTHKANNYLLTMDQYGQDTLPDIDFHGFVRYIVVDGVIRCDAGIITRHTFEREHEKIRAGQCIPHTGTPLKVDNWCVGLRYFEPLI